MYRVLSFLVLLLSVGLALGISAIALKSKDPSHFVLAFAAWCGVVWYLRFRRKALASVARAHSSKYSSVVAVTPSALVILALSFALPGIAFSRAGWFESMRGVWFLYFVLAGGLALVALGILVAFRSLAEARANEP